MKNNVTFLIVLCTIIGLIYLGLEGAKIGGFEILSVKGLIAKNAEVDQKIQEASKLTSEEHPDNIKTLEDSYKRYRTQKQKYEELVDVSDQSDENFYETKKYDIEYLWNVFGKYASKRNIKLGIQVQKNGTEKNSYNINFAVNGDYTNIINFIIDLENDSDLYFRIYDFEIQGKEVEKNGQKVIQITSTFTVRNVNLDAATIL